MCLAVLATFTFGCGSQHKVSRSEQMVTPVAVSASTVQAEFTLTVAAAADLKFAFDDLILGFAEIHPEIRIKVTFGSSGNLFAQLSNRAPFDLFFSADMDYPRRLIELGAAAKGSEFHYATGQLVIWVPNSSNLDFATRGIEAVSDAAVRKIAIANPKHAPYGRAAVAALKTLGVFDQIESRLVLGENVAQTAQFVETGVADLGLISQSLAMAPMMRDKGRSWPLPLNAYPPIEQGGMVLPWTKNSKAAELLQTFVLGDEGRRILKLHGFRLPGE